MTQHPKKPLFDPSLSPGERFHQMAVIDAMQRGIDSGKIRPQGWLHMILAPPSPSRLSVPSRCG